MKSKYIKNVNQRYTFNKNEINKKVDKFLFLNILNNKKISNKNLFSFLFNMKKSNMISKTKIKNSCIISGRNKSVEKKFSLSRIKLREFISFGILPGYKKAVW
jgi:small subunit ribosomal protein S14